MGQHKSTDRIKYIDVSKGILIMLVVIGHVLKGSTFATVAMMRIINAFHMPAFFIISGILSHEAKYSHVKFGEFLRKRFVRLIIPYITFEIIGGLWQMLLLGIDAVNIVGIVSGIFTVRCHVGADWFLVTLFFAEIITYWLSKSGNKKLYMIVIVISFLIAFFLPEKNYILGNCRRICVSLSYILMGICFKQFFLIDSKLLFVLSSIGLVAFAAINNVTTSIAMRSFGDPILFILCGIAGTYSTIFLSKQISKFDRLCKPFIQCGKASLVIMGTHQNVLIPFNIMFGNWTSVSIKLSILIITIAVEVPLIMICKKILPSWVGEQQPRKKFIS